MRSINRVSLIGHITHDPEVTRPETGVTKAVFSLATNRRYRNAGGEWMEVPDYHRLVAWRRLAEICESYLHKGAAVYVEGRLQSSTWEDKEGKKQRRQEVVVTYLNILRVKGNKIEAEEHLGQEEQRATAATKRAEPDFLAQLTVPTKRARSKATAAA